VKKMALSITARTNAAASQSRFRACQTMDIGNSTYGLCENRRRRAKHMDWGALLMHTAVERAKALGMFLEQ
jgi:hypothetical protein